MGRVLRIGRHSGIDSAFVRHWLGREKQFGARDVDRSEKWRITMLEALYQIGKVQDANILDEFIKPIKETYKYIIKIQFRKKEEEYEFEKIDFEENELSKKNRYLLLAAPSRGSAKTPCALVTDDIGKTFNIKIINSIEQFIKEFNPEISEKLYLEKLNACLKREKDEIQDNLFHFLEEHEEIAKSPKALILTFFENGQEIYPGDFAPFIKTLKNRGKYSFTAYYEKNRIQSIGRSEKQCFFCKEKKDEVWGYASPFAFYTVDKVSFVTGGFNPQFAWKNYPVCPDCAITLHVGANYVQQKLNFKFAGYTYFLLPQLVFFNEGEMQTILKRLQNYTDFGFSEKQSSRIEQTELYLIRELGKIENWINFNFMFYEKSNSAFNILLLLQEISPSRLKYLIEAKDIIDEEFQRVFKPIKTKKGEYIFDFNFHFLKEFFTGGKEDLDFKKSFLTLLRNIFYLKPISFDLLLDRFMAKIRKEFIQENEFNRHVLTLKALKNILFLEQIKILQRRKYTMNNTDAPFNEFFEKFKIFDDSIKRALFLEGLLAGKLLQLQYKHKNSKPFYSRLNALRIDEKIAKRLLPEMINKLEEYEMNYQQFKDIESAISFYFMNGDFSNYSMDELSFYFSLGLSMPNYFDSNFENNKEKNEN